MSRRSQGEFQMSKYSLSKWFARGSGHVIRYQNSETLLFQWNGKPDGAARFVPHVKCYARNGNEFPSLAALLRAVETEHA
jgi:hypothetical protein